MNSYHGSLYLCYDGKPWYALGVLTYAYNDYDLDRYITTLGPTVIANSDYSGKEYVGYAELGYKFNAGASPFRPWWRSRPIIWTRKTLKNRRRNL